MNKTAQLEGLVDQLKSKFQDTGHNLAGWYNSLPEDMRTTLMRGVLGAGAGAGGLALMHKLYQDKDPEHKADLLPSPLTGAVLGGLGAAGLPWGLKMLGQSLQERRPGHEPFIDQAANKGVGAAVGNLGTVAGGLGAAAAYHRWFPSVAHARARAHALLEGEHSLPYLTPGSGYIDRSNGPPQPLDMARVNDILEQRAPHLDDAATAAMGSIRKGMADLKSRPGATLRKAVNGIKTAPYQAAAASAGAGVLDKAHSLLGRAPVNPGKWEQLRSVPELKLMSGGGALGTMAASILAGRLADRYIKGRD